MNTIEGWMVLGSLSKSKSTTIGVEITCTESGNCSGPLGGGQWHCTWGRSDGRSMLLRQLVLNCCALGKSVQGLQLLPPHTLSELQSVLVVQAITGTQRPRLQVLLAGQQPSEPGSLAEPPHTIPPAPQRA